MNLHRVNLHRYESLHLNVMNRKKSVMSLSLNSLSGIHWYCLDGYSRLKSCDLQTNCCYGWSVGCCQKLSSPACSAADDVQNLHCYPVCACCRWLSCGLAADGSCHPWYWQSCGLVADGSCHPRYWLSCGLVADESYHLWYWRSCGSVAYDCHRYGLIHSCHDSVRKHH